MILPILCLAGASLVISFLATWFIIHLAPRIGFVDKPGHRKIHAAPKPLGGGVAIVVALALPMFGAIVAFNYYERAAYVVTMRGAPTHAEAQALVNADELQRALHGGVLRQTPLALTLLAATLVLHILGLFDDFRALGPYVKLVVQLVAASVLVVSFREMRILTTLGKMPSIALTILWIVAITNAFNFLDNMDGLSAGVAAVCTTAFLITAVVIQQWFVAATLALLLGALLGFLYWNFPPARIFMGDSGSLVIGFVLGVLTVRTTYLPKDEDFAAGWYSVFAPLIVLAVPLYDLIVVSVIRLSRGKSPFVGDTNHFSHRLVARGMSRRTAVLSIYLVTAATSVAAILLPHMKSTFGAMLIFAQTLLILGVVALLEQHPLPVRDAEDARAVPPLPPKEGRGEGGV
jgi:UDP-GlcNAc:undecaprenyl-phosphate GlcNAc-1-phosphate transferase